MEYLYNNLRIDITLHQQGWIQDFLREGASQADMTDVQSRKSAEELPNMHASSNWVSWQGTTGLVTA